LEVAGELSLDVSVRVSRARAVVATARRPIESWFGQFKKRAAWRAEWETIDQARHASAVSVDS
jgi:hypothetical protein